MGIPPVKQQVELQHAGDSGSLGVPRTLNMSALSDNPGDISRESGEVQEETDGEMNYNSKIPFRRSKRIHTANVTQILGAIQYVYLY